MSQSEGVADFVNLKKEALTLFVTFLFVLDCVTVHCLPIVSEVICYNICNYSNGEKVELPIVLDCVRTPALVLVKVNVATEGPHFIRVKRVG